jgi:hypothetical protein
MNAIETSATFRHGPIRIALVAALLLSALAAGVLFVTHPDRAQTPVARSIESDGPSARASTTSVTAGSAQAAAAPVASLASFTCSASTLTAGGAPAVAPISAVRTGSHAGYDRLVVQFSGSPPGSIELGPQGTATFLGAPSGLALTLEGQRGLKAILRGADMHTAYAGARDLKPGYPVMRETRVIEDFEGQVTLGIGLSGSGCYRAFVLANPARLVVDVQSA